MRKFLFLISCIFGALLLAHADDSPSPVGSKINSAGQIEYEDYPEKALAQIVITTKQVVNDYQCIPSPGNPPTGNVRVYCDSSTGLFVCKTSAGASCSSNGAAAGADTQVQFNDAGVFRGDAGLTYNKTTDSLTSGNAYFKLGRPWYDVSAYGALCNTQFIFDATITTGTPDLTSASGLFVVADVGKTVIVVGAGAASGPLITTISAFVSSTAVTLAANAGTSISGTSMSWGTDDVTAIQAAVNAVKNSTISGATNGGIVYFPGLCTISSTITTAIQNVTFEGVGSFYETTSASPISGLVYAAATGNAVTSTASGFNVRDFGIATVSSGDAINLSSISGGHIDHSTFYQMAGACAGCVATASTGNGIHFSGLDSGIRISRTKVVGFNNGILFDTAAAVQISDNNFIDTNRIGISLATTGGVTNVDIRDNVIQGNVIGNISVGANGANGLNIDGNYFEIQNKSATNSYDLTISGAAVTRGVSFRGNYTACNSITAGNVISLGGQTAGFDFEDNVFVSCSTVGNIINVGNGSTGLYLKNTKFSGGTPTGAVYLNNISTVVYDDFFNTTAPAFYPQFAIDTTATGIATLWFFKQGSACFKLISNGPSSIFQLVNSCHNGEVAMSVQTSGSTSSVTLPVLSLSSQAAPTGVSGTGLVTYDSTDKTVHFNANNNGDLSPSGAWSCTNVTPVTLPGTSTTGDQNLMACTIPAGTLNRVGRTLRVKAKGVYSTPAASVSQMTVKLKLCTVSGCGSGTVITPISIQSTALGTVQITNDNFSLRSEITTQTAGASSAYEASGEFLIDLATLTTAADSEFGDTNTATVGTIDSTAQLFLQTTIAFSVASTSNVATQRQLIVETVN